MGDIFILDFYTPEYRKDQHVGKSWHVADGGFWKPGPHLVLEQIFDYPEQAVRLNQFNVIELDGTLSIYRNWLQDYTPDTIASELEKGKFLIRSLGGDSTGKPHREASERIGIVAQKTEKLTHVVSQE